MNRHHEVMDEISGILQSEDYEPERFQEMCYELAEEIDELREVIRACAAGPWCFDVENAPKGEWLMVLTATGWCKAILSGEWWYGENGCTVVSPLAFAVPNPPQVAEDAADVHN